VSVDPNWQPATFINLGFEEVDAGNPGQPAGWIWRHHVTAFKLVTFAGSRLESFTEGWPSEVFALSLTDSNTERLPFVSAATPEFAEGFEHNWNNDQHLTSLENAQAFELQGPAGPLAIEGFGFRWAGNDSFLRELGAQSVGAAMFLPFGDPFESFDVGWRDNASFVFVLAPGIVSAALFSGAPFDGFENVKLDVPFLWDVGAQRVSAPGHGFVEGDLVAFYASGDGFSALPTNITATRRYRVHSPTTDSFAVENESGTLVVTAADPGSGAIFVKADTRSHWTTSLD
jgi:hypothetical protein